jgi:hypothetical protein
VDFTQDIMFPRVVEFAGSYLFGIHFNCFQIGMVVVVFNWKFLMLLITSGMWYGSESLE